MSTEGNIMIAQRFWEAFNAHTLAGWNEVGTTIFINHDPNLPIPDADLPRDTELMAMLRAAFPDITSSEDDVIAEGNKVVTRRTLRGTHTGQFLGMAATGKEVAFHSVSLAHFSDGTLTEQWIALDVVELFRQLNSEPIQAVAHQPARHTSSMSMLAWTMRQGSTGNNVGKRDHTPIPQAARPTLV